MSNWSASVDKMARAKLGRLEQRIDDLEAAVILRAAQTDFGLEQIDLYLLETNRRSYYAQATIKHRGGKTVRSIQQTPAGMTVHTILHEIAHHFPGGFDHNVGWVWAYTELVAWFQVQAQGGRFKTPDFDLDLV
jgi:hypothetical protein